MDNKLINQICSFIKKHNLLPSGSRVVLGLSGGPDSVFLLHFLADLHKNGLISLVAAHLDHEWRPNSNEDTIFCREMCQALEIPFFDARASELPIRPKISGSREEVGRILRRYFWEKIATENQADVIALGHHLQDQEETFIIRLVRGATLTGLSGMRPKHGLYIRPLLEINKNDILDFLDSQSIAYLTDPTNIEDLYLRNRIRKTVLPALREVDKRFDHNFLRTINHLQEAETFLEKITQQLLSTITLQENGKQILTISAFFELDPFMQKRILLAWLCANNVPFTPSEALLDEIIRFIKQPGSKKHQLHHAWTLIKKKNQLWIEQA